MNGVSGIQMILSLIIGVSVLVFLIIKDKNPCLLRPHHCSIINGFDWRYAASRG
ncbi:hypothetical protein SAMN05660826_02329 [Caldanaerovirga acetigignens]|uniref:Uncharacterized protein n=1 Tax=Caldanaerovirga acetigignens TaxID=447595 RepID=A0A1M7MK09_9FIRM|nr:hypothetical protein SAMN05660826_02329 [Caldanaerovirga acetigignens]